MSSVIIKNRPELETTPRRKLALDIIEAGIERVLPTTIMRSAVRYNKSADTLAINGQSIQLSGGRIFVIGGGKASGLMAETLEKIIPPERITAGIVTVKKGSAPYDTRKTEIVEAGHPVPDEDGITAVKRMLELKSRFGIGETDIVICLISGGGSALLPCPVDTVSLEDKQRVTGLLLACGADIHEINTVRKHLSMIKGGRLCEYYHPATVVSLILSDVIGNDLDVIASGPTSPDSSTFADACSVLKKYGLEKDSPASVTAYLDRGCRAEVAETPKILDNCLNVIIGDNRLALEAMAEKARESGLRPMIVTAEQKGETTEAAHSRAAEILDGTYSEYNAVILGGETTPLLPANPGKGGRNQHYAAVSLKALAGLKSDWVLASVGTDGSDYLPDIAGAIVDNRTLEETTKQHLDIDSYLTRYDSFNLLQQTGESLIVTGSTGTNVGDIILYLL